MYQRRILTECSFGRLRLLGTPLARFRVFFFGGGGGYVGGGRLFQAGHLLTFPSFRVGAYSRRALKIKTMLIKHSSRRKRVKRSFASFFSCNLLKLFKEHGNSERCTEFQHARSAEDTKKVRAK